MVMLKSRNFLVFAFAMAVLANPAWDKHESRSEVEDLLSILGERLKI